MSSTVQLTAEIQEGNERKDFFLLFSQERSGLVLSLKNTNKPFLFAVIGNYV